MKSTVFFRELVSALLAELPSLQDQTKAAEVLDSLCMVWADQEMRTALSSDALPLLERVAMLRKACGQNAADPVIHAAGILLREGLFDQFPLFVEVFHRAREDRGQNVTVEIKSAIILPHAEREAIRERLARRFGCPVTVHERIDPSVLGGLKISSESWELDATVRGRLERLSRAFCG